MLYVYTHYCRILDILYSVKQHNAVLCAMIFMLIVYSLIGAILLMKI